MEEIPNNYGPWAEPQSTVGFCFYCKKEKILCEIAEFVPYDMLLQAKKSTEILDDVKLPLVLCKICENKILQRRLEAMRNPNLTSIEIQDFLDNEGVSEDI